MTIQNFGLGRPTPLKICPSPTIAPRWTVLLDLRGATRKIDDILCQFVGQTRPFKIILMSNRSDEMLSSSCKSMLAPRRVDYVIVDGHPTSDGMTSLEHALQLVDTELVALCAADVAYPASYLEAAERVFDANPHNTAKVSAYFLPRIEWARRLSLAARQLIAMWPFARRLSADRGGYSFRMDLLLSGRDRPFPERPIDHEILRWIIDHGRERRSSHHWCLHAGIHSA